MVLDIIGPRAVVGRALAAVSDGFLGCVRLRLKRKRGSICRDEQMSAGACKGAERGS